MTGLHQVSAPVLFQRWHLGEGQELHIAQEEEQDNCTDFVYIV